MILDFWRRWWHFHPEKRSQRSPQKSTHPRQVDHNLTMIQILQEDVKCFCATKNPLACWQQKIPPTKSGGQKWTRHMRNLTPFKPWDFGQIWTLFRDFCSGRSSRSSGRFDLTWSVCLFGAVFFRHLFGVMGSHHGIPLSPTTFRGGFHGGPYSLLPQMEKTSRSFQVYDPVKNQDTCIF